MTQLSFLPHPKSALPDVPGLAYVEDYVSREEEAELIAAIEQQPWRTEWKRRRQVYGVSYGSAKGAEFSAPPLPAWLGPLIARVRHDRWLTDQVVNAVINEYLPGQGIGLHHDYPGFGHTVVAVSLGAPCILELVKPRISPDSKQLLDVQPRSLWVLGGEARSHWLHGIAARRTDVVGGVKRARGRRLSITLRTRNSNQGTELRGQRL